MGLSSAIEGPLRGKYSAAPSLRRVTNRQPAFPTGLRRETAQMAVMTGARSGEDSKRIEHTLMGPKREDARQDGQIRGRSRSPVRNAG